MSDTKKSKYAPSGFFVFFLIFVASSLIWVFAPKINQLIATYHGLTATPINEIGDSFGSINTLFSGLAFLGVIVTILLQSRELKLQREELAETREVFKQQEKELREQNKTQRLQRFENTLFNMISNYKDIVQGSEVKVNSITTKGRQSYRELFSYLRFKLRQGNTNDNDLYKVQMVYEEFYNKFEFILGHYIRNLYRIFKFIDDTDYIYKELKPFYADIVRAQLSNQELALLFYNVIAHPVGDNFKKYIIKYEVLDNLEASILAYENHKELIDKKAFGE